MVDVVAAPVVAAAEVMLVDPLHDLADIQQAVDALALDDADTNSMVPPVVCSQHPAGHHQEAECFADGPRHEGQSG